MNRPDCREAPNSIALWLLIIQAAHEKLALSIAMRTIQFDDALPMDPMELVGLQRLNRALKPSQIHPEFRSAPAAGYTCHRGRSSLNRAFPTRHVRDAITRRNSLSSISIESNFYASGLPNRVVKIEQFVIGQFGLRKLENTPQQEPPVPLVMASAVLLRSTNRCETGMACKILPGPKSNCNKKPSAGNTNPPRRRFGMKTLDESPMLR